MRHNVKSLIYYGVPVRQFKKDIIDLFTKTRGGHIDHWLYNDLPRNQLTGSQLWKAFLKASCNYYILPNEVSLIQKCSKDITKQMSNLDTVVDFGVGGEMAITNKVMPIISKLENLQQYTGVDISQSFLDTACKKVENDLGIKTTAIKRDFYKLNEKLSGNKRLGLMFGSTITNQDMKEKDPFPKKQIVKNLSHLKNLIGTDGKMLITYDGNQNIKSAMNAYNNIFWSQHVTGIAYDINKIAFGNFSITGWKHTKLWDRNASVIHQCIEATQKQEFYIDEHRFNINKGERFVAVNNFKYPPNVFKSMCEEAGFNLDTSYSDNQNRMHIQSLSI